MNRREFIELAISKGLPKERIREAMDARRSKIGAFDDDPADSAQPKPPAPPTQPDESWASRTAKAILPSATQEFDAIYGQPATPWQTVKDVGNIALHGAGDIVGLTARIPAKIFGGQPLSDQSSNLMRNQAAQASQKAQEDLNSAPEGFDPLKAYGVTPSMGGMPYMPAAPAMAPGLAQSGGLQLGDAATFIPASSLIKSPGKAAGLMAKGASAADRLSLAVAQELTDIPKEALSMAATKEGRAQLQALYGKEFEVGNKALEAAKAARYDMPESRLVDQAFREKNVTIPASEIERVADAGNVIPKDPIAGMSPTEQQAQDALEGWRNYMRGGEKPRDFGTEADAALAKSKVANMDALVSEQSSGITGKAATAAERKAEGAKRKAAKAAGEAAASRMKFLKAADDADKNLLRFGKARNETGAEAEAWLDEARSASAKARQDGIDARAKLAAGKISQADYDAAKAEAIFTQHEAMVAEVAKRLDKGQSIEDVGNQLARGLGMSADDIADVVSAARSRVRSNAPSIKDAPAENFRRRRMNLDFEINHDKEFKDVGDKAIAAMRKASKDALAKAAKEAGIEGYPEWMASMQKKLATLDEFDRLAGNTKMAKEARVESLIRNALGGTNPEYKRQLFKDLEALGVVDFGELNTMALSRKLGPEGVAPWLPPQHNGSFMKALAYLKAIGGVGIGSPKVYTRATLPTIRKAEEALSAAANSLTPRGSSALEALKKTDDAQKRARLLLIIENEMSKEKSNKEGGQQ